MTDATCPFCGSALPPKGATGPRKTYCSTLCRSRANYKKSAAEIQRRRSLKLAERRASTVRSCPRCSAEFTPARMASQVYCSALCSARAGRDSLSQTCTEPECERPRRARGLCNMHWRRVARAEGREKAPVWDERRAARHAARRAIKRGAPEAEEFSKAEVYERDGWICGLCDRDVDKSLAWPESLSVSLDHIVPLSKGGTHTLGNVQCAHLLCNLQKGATVAVKI